MGEVYRAHDTRLDRDVAIKVLPASVVGDADRRARFEREARAVAALNHPNILAVYDVGTAGDEAQGSMYLVTELLDGETVRDRLKAGPLPVRKATDIAIQIARGLAAAHDKGIVHRDLKPENVFLLKSGQVKILDFGLARLTVAPTSATETASAVTDPGAVLGTAGYMSPEQIRGQPTDARTDLFAFGAVLYELLAGQRAFRRGTVAETMTAILNEDPPDLSGVRTDLAPTLDRIVRHCLEKNPAERFQSAHDVAFALETMTASSPAIPGAARPQRRLRRALAGVGVAAILLAAGAGGHAVWDARPSAPVPPSLSFERKTWDPQWITNARFANDGKTIIFSAATTGASPHLYMIRPGSVAAQPFGPANTHLLSVSPTNELAVLIDATPIQHRLFNGTLARMTLESAVRPWITGVREADWSRRDGTTLAIVRRDGDLDKLEYPPGTVLHQATGYLSEPRVSPDGSSVAFVAHAQFPDDRGSVKTVDRGGHVIDLTEEFYAVEGLAWAPDGRSIVFSASPLNGGQQLLPYSVNTVGAPRARQALPAAQWTFVHDVAGDGRLLLTQEDLRVSLRGQRPGESSEREYGWLEWSSFGTFSQDGKWLLFSDQSQNAGANYQVALRGTDESVPVRLGEGMTLGFSPDGKWALAQIESAKKTVAYSTGAQGTRQIDRGPVEQYSPSSVNWFADGRRFLFCGHEPSRPPRCYVQSLEGGPPAPVTDEGTSNIRLAPDDRTVLMTTSDGQFQIDRLGEHHPVPARGLQPGDTALDWSRDARSVYVRVSGIGTRIDRVDVTSGQRTLAKLLLQNDSAGVILVRANYWPADGQMYAYSYMRDLSRMFVASGVNLGAR
jgi:serine/threonine protein kinase